MLKHPPFLKGIIKMRIFMYKMDGDKRYMDKTPFMTPLFNEGEPDDGSVDAKILDDTDVLNPVFSVSYAHYWKRCNYIWCEDTCRYYYITNPVLSSGRIIMNAHVDAMMTFRNALKERMVIIKRTEDKRHYNKYLQDDRYMTCASPQVRTVYFKQPATNAFGKNNRHYVLCLVGKGEVTPTTPTENNS
jgi:hypothetical protein